VVVERQSGSAQNASGGRLQSRKNFEKGSREVEGDWSARSEIIIAMQRRCRRAATREAN